LAGNLNVCSRQILNAERGFENDFPAIMAMNSIGLSWYTNGGVKTLPAKALNQAAERPLKIHITARFLHYNGFEIMRAIDAKKITTRKKHVPQILRLLDAEIEGGQHATKQHSPS